MCPFILSEDRLADRQVSSLVHFLLIIIEVSLGKIMTPDYQYKEYVLDCGHTQRIKKVHYKDNKYRCNACLKNKHEKEAEQNDLTILESDSNGSYRKYKFNGCGHEKFMLPDQVRTSSFKCNTCVDGNLSTTLLEFDIQLLNKIKSKIEIRYNSCNHTLITKYSHLVNKTIPKCKECSLVRIKQEALNQDLILLGKDNSVVNLNAYFYKLPCGCEKSLLVGNVRRGSWSCDTHSSWWNKPSFLYLIKFVSDEKTWLKLGVTSDVKRRIWDYKLKIDCTNQVVFSLKIPTYKQAVTIEKAIHLKFKELNLDHDLMSTFMTNGHTECYSEDCLSALLIELVNAETILNIQKEVKNE